MAKHQSAYIYIYIYIYGQFYSIKTAYYNVYIDYNDYYNDYNYSRLTATDRGLFSALCLLDLTAAFDTVDHVQLFCSRANLCSTGRGVGFVRAVSFWRTCVNFEDKTSSVMTVICRSNKGSSLFCYYLYCILRILRTQPSGTACHCTPLQAMHS